MKKKSTTPKLKSNYKTMLFKILQREKQVWNTIIKKNTEDPKM